jgi:NAD(P)-dependent dehydrogenase (short-subunit alcohol dehydrogenase family)
MDLGLSGKRALVLASSSGLGHAVAAGLAREGARVVVTSRDLVRATTTAGDVGAEAGVAGDLATPDGAQRLVEEAVELLGGLDVCVVNTGGGKAGGILHTDEAADETSFAAMLRPALVAARAAAGPLRASGDGRLLFLTARSVVEATPELALSSVFRSGVAAAARSLALELAPEVLVNVIVTGQFDTPALARFEAARAELEGTTAEDVRAAHVQAIPLGRLGRADELAAVAVFLCSARASYVTGTLVRVDGGSVRGF